MFGTDIRLALFRLIATLLSLTVHEWAHASAAVAMGDDTPERQGRHTLNPIPHIDLFGTLLIPLFLPFGWAKPVQWNPARIRRGIPMRRAAWIVAIAGPLSNIVIAFLCMLGLTLALRFGARVDETTEAVLSTLFIVNVGLGVFNMIPIPPLDGSRIVDANMPPRFAEAWGTVHQYAPFILFGVIILSQRLDLFGPVVNAVSRFLMTLALRLAGLGA